MKIALSLSLWLSVFLVGTAATMAQQETTKLPTVKKKTRVIIDKSNVSVQRYTVMSKFDTEMASSEEDRMAKKQNRIAETERRLNILDTLDISERKRRALLRDLEFMPFSNRLKKATLVDTGFEDEITDNKKK